MIKIKEVKTKKEQRKFLKFPYFLYKGNPYYVPSLYIDEKKIFNKNYFYNETSKSKFFLAYKDNLVVGRIHGIISYASNEKWNQKRIRFTRFDSIDDQNVANLLFKALEDWAKEEGLDEINGPLGYSDLEREGLLIKGFSYLNTYEEQYNYPYYQRLVENYGFIKEVDWYEHRIFKPNIETEKVDKIVESLVEKYNLKIINSLTKKELINKYAKSIFKLLDEAYGELYQTVPLTNNQIEALIKNYELILNPRYFRLVLNDKDELISFGFCLPSLSDALKGGSGKLSNPKVLFKLLKDLNKPKKLDFCVVGVRKDYFSLGIASVIFAELIKFLNEEGIESCETNLTLETNHNIINCWKRFDRIKHKVRRAYIKKID